LLAGVIGVWYFTGSMDFVQGGILRGKVDNTTLAILLALFAFGTGKAALLPFHKWLPNAMVAPTPVSALLHAVAVVKAGVFTIMKVVVYIFGIDLLAETGASEWLMAVAATTILFTSCVALTKDNLKARLAYSTISQLSYIVLGAAMANAAGAMGGSMHIVMHAMGKITLFFCAGAIFVGAHLKNISDMDGLAKRMPWTLGAFTIASFSIIGLPPLGGVWGKWFLGLGALETGQTFYLITLLISSLLSIGYLMPVVGRAYFRPAPAHGGHGDHHGHDDHGHDDHGGGGEAPLMCVVPLCMTAVGCILLFIFPEPIQELLAPIFQGVAK
ncbi:MAG: monovalent cation/H+ antiporter subunit D family protein, partial [Deltaproteobacteria bacterium]|nr:monovalent cation/H+ antiporter subunit D family protein [Deltaproteobacteria bacterium]